MFHPSSSRSVADRILGSNSPGCRQLWSSYRNRRYDSANLQSGRRPLTRGKSRVHIHTHLDTASNAVRDHTTPRAGREGTHALGRPYDHYLPGLTADLLDEFSSPLEDPGSSPFVGSESVSNSCSNAHSDRISSALRLIASTTPSHPSPADGTSAPSGGIPRSASRSYTCFTPVVSGSRKNCEPRMRENLQPSLSRIACLNMSSGSFSIGWKRSPSH